MSICCKKESNLIKTKFGNAKIHNSGYYIITSRVEGNHHKLLHRLIFEDFYQIKLPKNIVIHHEDGNKLNNEIWNLVPMTDKEHNSLHNTGEKSNNYGKYPKLSSRIKKSLNDNTTGFFRVGKRFDKRYASGFIWVYQFGYKGKQKQILSTDLLKLKNKIISRGMDWFIIDEEKALKTIINFTNYSIDDFINEKEYY